MKFLLPQILFLLAVQNSSAQIENGYYRGLERMCWINDKGKIECYNSPRKWYHLNELYVENDSAFLYKSPIQIVKKDTIYSASDGAFYYYLGTIHQTDTGLMINLKENSCDYCGQRVKTDSASGFMYPIIPTYDYKLTLTKNGIQFNNVEYTKTKSDPLTSEFKKQFYFDSNSIYRINPKVKYKLMSEGIKCLLQTKDILLDNDTLRICIERLSFGDSILEQINPESLLIDITGIQFKYYSLSQIEDLTNKLNKPVRFVEIREIIDYMKAARISLKYKISLPSHTRHFSERQVFNTFEFTKIENEYKLTGNLPENNWELVERK
jgi:hypothetical protein